MRYFLQIHFLALVVSMVAFPEILTVSTSTTNPGCTGTITPLQLYRCVCRADIATVGGGVSSIPLQVFGSSTVIYSPENLNGTRCQGTIASGQCVPPALVGAQIVGKYNCALGTANSSGGFDIQF